MDYDRKSFLNSDYRAAIRLVIDLAQDIDRRWDKEGHESRLENLLNLLEDCLEHPHGEVQKLNQSKKHLDGSKGQTHFLSCLIPLERAFAKSVADSEILPLREIFLKQRRKPISPSLLFSIT